MRRPPFSRALSLALAAGLACGGVAPVPAARAAAAQAEPALGVRVGQASGLTHVEFSRAPASVRRDGRDLVLRFARAARADVARLTRNPVQRLKAVVATPSGAGLELRFTPAGDSVLKSGSADGAAFVNASPLAPDADAGSGSGQDQRPGPRADPAPGSAPVKMAASLQARTLRLRFGWKAPVGAAVFRRGAAIWVVFDAPARLDLTGAPSGLPQLRRAEAVGGADFAAVRLIAPAGVAASVEPAVGGAVWTVALSPGGAPPPAAGVVLSRDDQAGPPTLTAQLAGATGVFWIKDPEVGDRLAVVTALAPAKGLATGHGTVQADLLPTAQGLALAARADDLTVSTDGDLVRIGRPRGMALSSPAASSRGPAPAAAPLDLPRAAALPGLVDFAAWSRLGPGGFMARYDQLLALASEEAAKGKAGGVQARLALARFLVGSELSFEAIGVLNGVARADQSLLADPEFRGLRGAARVIAGRYKDAQADFSSPVTVEDPASSLWRGYAADRLGDSVGALQQFVAGRSALAQVAPAWRARFLLAQADAALAANDLATARVAVMAAAGLPGDAEGATALKLMQARLADASGQPGQALPLYEEVANAPDGGLAAPALLHATQLKLAAGKLSVGDATATLESLRFRWRGDATEFETVRALGRIYLGQGHYREALEALRSAGQRRSDNLAAAGAADDLQAAFRTLFLQGGADGLQPIQALGLFYDFKDQTPVGADGDLMVRRLARRLVDVDLLGQAGDLLKYQADNRLDGAARAEVSTDLATIDLMDHRPEDALQAINGSRSTLLPAALNGRRRQLEARAHLMLGAYDAATEVLEGDRSAEAQSIRADTAWKRKAWPEAAALLESGLGERWKSDAPLSMEEQARLLRAGAAYSLAGDDGALMRLRARYGRLADAAPQADALRVALAGTDASRIASDGFARGLADAAVFAGWCARMKQHFRDPPIVTAAAPARAPPPAAKPALAQAKLAGKAPKRG